MRPIGWKFVRRPSVRITALLAVGTVLALALLAQTIINYQYVSSSLIRQEGRRVVEDIGRALERAVRSSRPEDASAFSALLQEFQVERRERIAWIVVRQGRGNVTAASGDQANEGGRDLLVTEVPCRCGPVDDAVDAPGRVAGTRASAEIALYRDTLSAPFARLRRDALLSGSAALTLLVSLLLIALRFGTYVRGKQLEAQVTLAREVQQNLLPDAASVPSGVDFAAECRPASRVGGDFYDVVGLPKGRFAMCVGDVSGHGIAAAMLMALIHGAMSDPPWGVSDDEVHRADVLNRLLLLKSSPEHFASLFWSSFDPVAGRLRYVNAGHPPPLWIRRQGGGVPVIERLTRGGPVLGLVADAVYPAESIVASAGDVLVLFSDGLIEATNDRDEFFGDDRLTAVVRRHIDLPARAMCDAILAAVSTFADGAVPLDDQTLLVVTLPASAV